jgi:hypothetical protein
VALPKAELAETTAKGSAGARSTNVVSGETHHIATVYGEYGEINRQMFEEVFGGQLVPVVGPKGIRYRNPINHPLNLIIDFVAHGQIRGWLGNNMEPVMRGHHPDYNDWVTYHLLDVVTTRGLTPDQRFSRFVATIKQIRAIVELHPDVLIDGPGILPVDMQNLNIHFMADFE